MKKTNLSMIALSTFAAISPINSFAAIEEGQLTIWMSGDKGMALISCCLPMTDLVDTLKLVF